MSANIVSDGSPTPRKGFARFSVAEDRSLDASGDMMGQGVGARPYRPPHIAHRILRQLTTNSQALKREGSQDKITTLSGLQQQMPAPTAVTKHPVLKVSIITLSPCRAQANQYSCLEV